MKRMYTDKNTKADKMFLLVALMTSLFSLLFAAASCSDDLVGTEVVSGEDDVPGGVYIITRVADSSYGTRSSSSISTTASWQGGDFDEVGITSLSVLFFKPVSSTDTVLAYAFTTTLPEDTTKRDYVTTSTGEKGIRWLVPNWPTSTSTSMSDFTLTDATTFSQTVTPTPIDSVPATYTIYAIANHEWGDNDLTIGTTTPAALRELLTNEDDSTEMAQQPAVKRTYGTFEMSDYIVGSSSYKDYTDEYGVAYRRDYELTLKRAVGKMCLRVYYTASDASSPTLLTEAGGESSTDDNDFHNTEHEISFRLVRYAACAPLTADGTDLTTVYSKSGSSTTNHSLYTQTEFADPTSDNGMLYQYGATSSSSTDDDGNTTSTTTYDDACVVFYSYPNNWADSSAIEAGTINLNTTVPIVEDRQTYVQMQIKHTPSTQRSVTYTYDIPTNYLLPEYNDAVSLTDAQKEELYAAYRIDRNTAYWMTLYVEEVEAGLRVACSSGSGASASIADLEDDPNVVVLSATTTTVTINDFDDGTGDEQQQQYDTATGDSVSTVGYTWTDFSETVYLSDTTFVITSSTSGESVTNTDGNNGGNGNGDGTAPSAEGDSTDGDSNSSSSSSSSQSATFSADTDGYPCTGTLMLTSYTDNSNWTAVSSTSYTATSSTDSGEETANTREGSASSTDGTEGTDGSTGETTDGDTTTTTSYTATVSSIVCATVYTCSGGTTTLSSTITVTYSISGGTTGDEGSSSDNSISSVSITYYNTGSSLSSWTESSDTTSGEGTEE